MKQFIASAVIAAFTLSLATPSFTQRSRPTSKRPVASTSTASNTAVQSSTGDFNRIEAVTVGSGILVRWIMNQETRVAGYLVYRIDGETRTQIAFVPGAGFKTRFPTRYGEEYSTYDAAGTLNSRYEIETVNASGSVSASPVRTGAPKFVPGASADISRAASVAQATSDNGTTESVSSRLETQSVSAPNLTEQQRIAAMPGVKIQVIKEGFYRVTQAELSAAGFDTGTDSTKWRLFMRGNEQAIKVGPGNAYIEFYGKADDTVETDSRIYFLILDAVNGLRMQDRVMRSVGGTSFSSNTPSIATKIERTIHLSTVLNNNTADESNYYGTALLNGVCGSLDQYHTTNVTFTLPNLDTTATGTTDLVVTVHGFNQYGYHETAVKVNEHDLIGVISGSGIQEDFSRTYSIPLSYLQNGTNTLGFTNTLCPQIMLFKSVRVAYPQKTTASQNIASLVMSGRRKVAVDGFTAPAGGGATNIRVFDITNEIPQELTNLVPMVNGTNYGVLLPAYRHASIYAVEDSSVLQAASVVANVPSSLSSSNNSGNYLIITNSTLIGGSAAQDWAAYRSDPTGPGGHFTVKTVNVTDIYDEFSYGVRSSKAINSFLKSAASPASPSRWTLPPAYVLLLGDATWDPRNFLGGGAGDLVPTQLVDLVFDESGSDEALADFDGNGLADVAIGRIPVRNDADASRLLQKTKNQELPALQSFSRGVLFANDIPTDMPTSPPNFFYALNVELRNELTAVPDPSVTFVSRGFQNNPMSVDPNARPALLTALNQSPYIVNYAGHGSSGSWATVFFTNNDVPNLSGQNQSIFTMLTCLNALFTQQNADSLAEKLLKSTQGGASITWASSTETTPDQQRLMGMRFYKQLNAGVLTRIGDLVTDAKSDIPVGYGLDVRYSWVLLGDPATQIRP